jgi:hypothetical protein
MQFLIVDEVDTMEILRGLKADRWCGDKCGDGGAANNSICFTNH